MCWVLGLLAHKTLRIGSLGLSYFPFIFLCVNLLRQGVEMDLYRQKMNLLHSSTIWPSSIHRCFCPQKVEKNPPFQVAQKYSKSFHPFHWQRSSLIRRLPSDPFPFPRAYSHCSQEPKNKLHYSDSRNQFGRPLDCPLCKESCTWALFSRLDLVCWSRGEETRRETSRTVPPTGNVQSQDPRSFILHEEI